MSRSSWIFWVGPKSNDQCPSRRCKRRDRQTQGEATAQEGLEIAGAPRSRKHPPKNLPGNTALPTPGFWTSGLKTLRMQFLLF